MKKTGRCVSRLCFYLSPTVPCLVIMCLLAACRAPAPLRPEPQRDHPPDVVDYVPSHRMVDHRPYEFIWTDRRAEHDALIDFEGLIGWRAEMSGEGTVLFERSREQQLFGPFTGLVQWRARAPDARITLIPPQPIPVSDRFDTMECWLFGGDAATLEAVFLDAQEKEWRIPFAPLTWTGWGLAHKTLSDETIMDTTFPLQLKALEIIPLGAQQDGAMYLDNFSVYTTRLRPLRPSPRPRRAVDLFPGQQAGLHVGKGVLSFPVTNHFLYGQDHGDAEITARKEPDTDSYAWHAQKPQGRLTFRVHDETLTNGVAIRWNDQPVAMALAGLAVKGDLQAGRLEPIVERFSGQALYREYERGDAFRWHMHGYSLALDISARGGWAESVSWPGVAALDSYRVHAHRIPFLHAPLYACVGSTNLFVFQSLDYYRSSASVWDPARGEVQYKPTTRGRRNDVFERLYVSVSTRVEDVWPTTPHVPAPRRDILSRRLWLTAQDSGSWTQEWNIVSARNTLGLHQILYGMHEKIWRENDESRSLRVRANPFRGGDAALASFMESLRGLGWMSALYMNQREISPLNQHWSSDAVIRTPDGNLLQHDPPAFALRDFVARSWAQESYDEIERRYLPDALWMPQYSARPPWAYTDYDARAPGAGSFVHGYYVDGEWLQDLATRADAPVVITSDYAWMYAGLADGMIVNESLWADVWMPLYKWEVLHPLSVFFGAGPMPAEQSEASLDRYLATQIAYGMAGVIDTWDDADAQSLRYAVRSYYMLLALQQRYLASQPTRILFWDGTAFLHGSDALISGAWQREQMYMRFPCDMELWVNGGSERLWSVRLGLETYDVPSSGWLASGPDIFAFSGLFDNGRVDYMETPAYTYFDGRGSDRPFRGIQATGPVIRIQHESHEEWLNPSGLTTFAMDAPGDSVRVEAETREGDPVETISILDENGFRRIDGPPEAYRYRVFRLDAPAQDAQL
jgi:hypothetical protein